MTTGARSPRRTPRAGLWLIAGLLAALALLLASQLLSTLREPQPDADGTSPPAVGEPSSPSPGTPLPTATQARPEASGYFVTTDELLRRRALAETGLEPYRTAVDALRMTADQAMTEEPRPRNPITHARGRFLEDSRNAYTLALASLMTGEPDYADRSAAVIMAWVTKTDAIRHACPQTGGSDCATSLLVSRNAPAFVFAADLLEDTGAFSAADRTQLEVWLRDVILPVASERTNNWGDAGTFMRLVVTDYIGDDTAFEAAADDWRDMMDLVTPEGEIPEESRRGRLGLLYTQGAISYKAASALVAERRGLNLWEYEGEAGGSLRAAIDLVARYWHDPAAWPWHDRVETPDVDPIWEIIYQRWPEPEYAAIFESHRPLGSTNPSAVIWTTVTNGEPIEDDPE